MGLFVLQWHITHRCNLHCVHCYQGDYAAEMKPDLLREGLEKYLALLHGRGLEGQVNLTGGEPLLHPEFWDLAQEIRRENLRLGVLTNGTLICEETARRLSKLRPCFVQVSLDGTREHHDIIRGAGAFDRALAGIDCLKRNGVRVHVSFTAQKRNYRDFPLLAKVCRKHRVDKLWWDRVVSSDTQNLALSTEEFAAVSADAARCRRRYRRLHDKSMVSCGRALQFLAAGRPCRYRCGAGGDLLIYLADGSIMPCRRLPYVIGNIRDGGLEETIAASEIMRRLAKPYVPEGCENCRHSLTCRGGARCVTLAQTGRLNVRDVNCTLEPGGNQGTRP